MMKINKKTVESILGGLFLVFTTGLVVSAIYNDITTRKKHIKTSEGKTYEIHSDMVCKEDYLFMSYGGGITQMLNEEGKAITCEIQFKEEIKNDEER